MQELDYIYSSFSDQLTSEVARHDFNNTPPFHDSKKLQENISISKEVYSYCENYTSFSFLDLADIRQAVSFSEKDYVLDTKDIYHTYLAMKQWHQLTILEILPVEYPLLHEFIHEIIFPRTLLDYWKNAFDGEGNIADSASPELKRIRSLKKTLRQQIEKILQKQLKNNDDLAEKRIAFREDRYVLPIKSVAKNRNEGIVHGFSNSGTVTYIEPPEIIAMNNELLSVDDLEHQEIHRLLRQWSKIISEYIVDIILIVNRSAQLEILFNKYYFAKKYNAIFAQINENQEIILEDVYNPFLLLKKGQETVIPITIELEQKSFGIIISGPNAGGKSAALKTLAICSHMFLIGLPIPAKTVEFPFFSDILIEIGDSQNLDDDLSTFSGHLYNIKDILKKSNPSTLVLIDEIAHATDPIEGEALACAIIDELVKKQTFFAITTHYKQVKVKCFEHAYIKSYATGFDIKKLSPQFTLYPNSMGESYALNIATRVGLAPHIVKEAHNLVNHKKDKTELILSNIEEYEKNLRQKELHLKQLQDRIEREKRESQSQKDLLNHQIAQLQKEGLAQADKELSFCLRELSALQKNMAKNPKETAKSLKKIQELVNEKKSEITQLIHVKKTHIEIGEKVFVSSLNQKAVVESIQKNSVTIRAGFVKISVKKSDIFETEQETTSKKKSYYASKQYTADIAQTVDVHGMTKEEALAHVDKYMYAALASGLDTFIIIHGKGLGILQKAVHYHLKYVKEVKNFRFATPQEGGSGKTIVYFI